MKFARKTDIIIIIVLIAAGLLIWAYFSSALGNSGAVAEIYYKSNLAKTVDLSTGKEENFSLDELPNVVFHQYADGSIAFIASDCPDKVCIKAGRLHLPGQIAACLPNQVYIKIVSGGSDNSNAPDVIIG